MSVIDGELFPATFWDPEAQKAPQYDCNLATFDSRYDAKGQRFLFEVRRDEELRDSDDDYLTSNAALVLTRVFDRHGRFENAELRIRSRVMQEALSHCIKSYPGVDLHADPIVLINTPRCLFFYFKELEQYGRDRQDLSVSRCMTFLLKYIAYRFRSIEQAFPGLMKGTAQLPINVAVDWPNLWLFYRPGTLVYRQDMSGVPIVSKVEKIRICECDKAKCPHHSAWTILVLNVEFTGQDYEWTRTELRINKFEGYRPLDRLAVVPFDHVSTKDEMFERVLQRGRKYLEMSGVHYRYYDGVARFNVFSSQIFVRDMISQHMHTEMKKVRGRFMIDRKAYAEVYPKRARRYDDEEDPEEMDEYYRIDTSTAIMKDDKGVQSLSDTEIATCVYQIAGFSLQFKTWCLLDLEYIREVDFNENAFDRLMLPDQTKAMMKALVDSHSQSKQNHFDDVIKGKGKGLVFLLHGVPGVGKTLTAESIAETLKKPLYTLTSGDLGVDATTVETRLSDALQFATKWNAIVLIDEADVFLAERDFRDVKRNALVSVFLRMLEYFEGVMILTTNRVATIDTAFLSRVHHSVQYDDHSVETRHKLWENFVRDVPPDQKSSELNADAFAKLASYHLNGRQIRNCMRTAVALANSGKKLLTLQDLDSTAQATLKSCTELQNGLVQSQPARRSEQEDEPSSSGYRPTKRRRIELGDEA